MTTELTTNNLSAPIISGTVTVSLVDLDKMRSDHANTIKLAKELEERQPSIRIDMDLISSKKVPYDEFGSFANHSSIVSGYQSLSTGPTPMKQVTRERIVSYKNLEEIVGPLKQELDKEYATRVDASKKEVSSLKETIYVLDKERNSYIEDAKTYKTKIKDFEKDTKEHKKVMKTISSVAVSQAGDICDLVKELNRTKTKLQIAVFKNTNSSYLGKIQRFFNI